MSEVFGKKVVSLSHLEDLESQWSGFDIGSCCNLTSNFRGACEDLLWYKE